MKKFSLEFLDISSNQFRDEIDLLSLLNMNKLSKLNISGNDFDSLPDSLIKKLKKKFNSEVIFSVLEESFKKSKDPL